MLKTKKKETASYEEFEKIQKKQMRAIQKAFEQENEVSELVLIRKELEKLNKHIEPLVRIAEDIDAKVEAIHNATVKTECVIEKRLGETK